MGAEIILENFEDLDALGDKHRLDIIETTKIEVFEALKENLRPEFLNRIDEKIMFLPLSKVEIKQIAVLMLKKLTKNLAKQDINIEFDDKALTLLADLGYEPAFGARPMARVIQAEIINQLAKQVLSGTYAAGDTIFVGTDAKGFTFGNKKTESKEAPKVDHTADNKIVEIAKLNKATKDVKKAVEDAKNDDEDPDEDK